jgi:hypothetical protein
MMMKDGILGGDYDLDEEATGPNNTPVGFSDDFRLTVVPLTELRPRLERLVCRK